MLPLSRLLTHLGRVIRTLRKPTGYSQETFADSIGVHRTTMGHLERGEGNPTMEILHAVAVGLGVGIADLIARATAEANAEPTMPAITRGSKHSNRPEPVATPRRAQGRAPNEKHGAIRPEPKARNNGGRRQQ
jgi:transcriptional regulator with XRE-family HTH domain